MRVIAGSAGGLALKPPGMGTRPTMDRVKGAIFSTLGERVPNSRVLDMFAGSGALGIEALSRGATCATFVENHGPTAALIRRNLKWTNLEGIVQQMDAFRFLELHAKEGCFDLIFADPPYLKSYEGEGNNSAETLLAHPSLPTTLGSEGLFVLECAPRQPLPSLSSWVILSDRTYGESRVLILRNSA